jgi:hypothetical protein
MYSLVLVLALDKVLQIRLLYTFISRGTVVDALTPVLGVDNDNRCFHYCKTRERYCRHNTNQMNNS